MTHDQAATLLTLEVGDLVYRVEDKTYAAGGMDINGDWIPSPFGPGISIDLHAYGVDKLTPKGFWCALGKTTDSLRGPRRWFSYQTRQRHRTPAEATKAAVSRRAYHLKMARQRLAIIERRLHALENWSTPKEDR